MEEQHFEVGNQVEICILYKYQIMVANDIRFIIDKIINMTINSSKYNTTIPHS